MRRNWSGQRHRLAVRNLGDVDWQTVAGGLATDTCGTDLQLPTLGKNLPP